MKGIIMAGSLGDLIKSAMDEADETKSKSEEGPTDLQVITRLKDVFDNLQEEHRFTPGQVLMHKYPKSCILTSMKLPVVFLEYLPEARDMLDYIRTPNDLGYPSSGMVVDARVLVYSDGRMYAMAVDSREFKPHEGE